MNTRTRRAWIVVAVLVGAIVVLNLLARGLDEAVGGNEPGGADGSSYDLVSSISWSRLARRSF